MSTLLNYFTEMIVCSGILYVNYYLLLRNNKFHSYNRYYLLAAVVLSILMPFVHIPVDFGASQDKPAVIWQTLTAISSVTENKHVQILPGDISNFFTLNNILMLLYGLVACAIFSRLVTAIIFIKKLLRKYKVRRTSNIYFINTEEPATPFSFFKWLFWNNKVELQSEKGQQMFRHEIFHIQQRHSWDLTFLELSTAVFWINPFFHFIKKEVKTIHEFLADEFATKENDKWNYAELLLMQVLGSSSNRLVNPFFHNQIKRRIAMITSSKTPKHQFFRKLVIFPIAFIVFLLFAFKIKNYSEKAVQEPMHYNAILGASDDSKTFAIHTYPSAPDTIKPKEKHKTKEVDEQKEPAEKSDSENEQFKKLTEGKAREAQESQERVKQLMAERQKEVTKFQEEFKKMMEVNQREARENQEKLKLLMEQRQQEAAKYQGEFKKMMKDRQREEQQQGQERFKRLMQDRQQELEKFQEQFKEMLMMKQNEAERSQQELKKLLEERQQQIQKLHEDFKEKIMLMQEKTEKAKKQVI